MPALIGENKNLAEQFEELHELAGTTGYFLIGLHTVAALYHHHFVHDNTLTPHAARAEIGPQRAAKQRGPFKRPL